MHHQDLRPIHQRTVTNDVSTTTSHSVLPPTALEPVQMVRRLLSNVLVIPLFKSPGAQLQAGSSSDKVYTGPRIYIGPVGEMARMRRGLEL